MLNQTLPIFKEKDCEKDVTVTNKGDASANNLMIEDVAPAGSLAENVITFRPLASLAPKAKATWRVVVKAKDADNVRFKVAMNSDQLTRPVEETESTNFYK